MRKPALTLLLAVAVGVPGIARPQMSNPAPVVDAVTVSPSPATASGTATISCSAHDNGLVTALGVSVSGGTLPNGTATDSIPIAAAASVSGTIAWTAPSTPGGYTVTCTATDNGGRFGGNATGSLAITATVAASAGPPPVVDALGASATQVYPGDVVRLTATAHDAASGPLTYGWTATGGTLDASGASATWTAPATPGAFTVTVSASNAAGSASATAAIQSSWTQSSGSYAGGAGFVPARIAVDAAGYAYVTSSRARAIFVLTPVGRLLRTIATRGTLTGIALGAGGIWVADEENRSVELVDPMTGTALRALGAGRGEFRRPVDVAVSPRTGAVIVADAGGEAPAVRVFDAAGAAVASFPIAGMPTGVAVDAASGQFLVSDAMTGAVRVFGATGEISTIGSFGVGDGQLDKPAGVAIGADGNVYVVDTRQERVAVFTRGGTFLAFTGQGGDAPGTLSLPVGIAADPSGHLVLANTYSARVESLALKGAAPRACPIGDSDCDGMPDWWEIAHGLDPNDPRDAWIDSDGDGLVNLLEYLHGTDPFNRDSDGDGYTDGEEVATGYDPLDGSDHAPRLLASAPAESDPGLVRLSWTVANGGGCSVRWTQASGPEPVKVEDDRYVARKAGAYAFDGVATCGRASSAPARVATTIRQVAPRPDAGRISVVGREEDVAVVLDGGFSSDANGDPIAFRWDQVLGKPVTSGAGGAVLPLELTGAGLYQFRLTASDGVASAQADVPVLVAGDDGKTLTAVAATPIAGEAGREIRLAASALTPFRDSRIQYAWVQISGEPVQLANADEARASFVPPAPGRYAFQVTAIQRRLRSPPASVDVFVAPAGAGLPAAVAAAPQKAAVGAPVELDGTRSAAATGAGLAWAWRQVSGPAAGLTDADRAVATVVPFAPGTYVFELSVREGAAASPPARVRFDADRQGTVRPVAVARAPAVSRVEARIVLDGSASTAARGKKLRHRWTQVAGPWVPLDVGGDAPGRATLRPRVPGTYVFELEVDDGAVRSAPASVKVDVQASGEEEESR